MTDPALLDLRAEIALVDSRIEELLGRIKAQSWTNPMENDLSVEAALPKLLDAALDDQSVARLQAVVRTTPWLAAGSVRSLVVQFGASPGAAAETDPAADGPRLAADCRHTRNYLWAELMRRSLDVLACPRCGGRLTVIALIEDPAVLARVLRHLGLPTDIPEAQPARAPPLHLVVDAPLTEVAGDQWNFLSH